MKQIKIIKANQTIHIIFSKILSLHDLAFKSYFIPKQYQTTKDMSIKKVGFDNVKYLW